MPRPSYSGLASQALDKLRRSQNETVEQFAVRLYNRQKSVYETFGARIRPWQDLDDASKRSWVKSAQRRSVRMP